jgi:hypothetical protein
MLKLSVHVNGESIPKSRLAAFSRFRSKGSNNSLVRYKPGEADAVPRPWATFEIAIRIIRISAQNKLALPSIRHQLL